MRLITKLRKKKRPYIGRYLLVKGDEDRWKDKKDIEAHLKMQN